MTTTWNYSFHVLRRAWTRENDLTFSFSEPRYLDTVYSQNSNPEKRPTFPGQNERDGMRAKKFAAVAASLGTIRNYDGNGDGDGDGDDKVIKQKVKAPFARMRFIFLRFGLRSARIQWRRSPKTHVSKRSPVWRFLKTPAYRFRLDGRKRRFSITMMSYIKQRMPCKTCYHISFRVDGRKQFEFATLRLRGRAGRYGCQVRCGTVLKDKFAACWKCVPQNSPMMHFANQLDPVSRASSKCRIRPSKSDSWSIKIQANFTLAYLSSIYRVFFQDATETHERLCSRELSIFPSPW